MFNKKEKKFILSSKFDSTDEQIQKGLTAFKKRLAIEFKAFQKQFSRISFFTPQAFLAENWIDVAGNKATISMNGSSVVLESISKKAKFYTPVDVVYSIHLDPFCRFKIFKETQNPHDSNTTPAFTFGIINQQTFATINTSTVGGRSYLQFSNTAEQIMQLGEHKHFTKLPKGFSNTNPTTVPVQTIREDDSYSEGEDSNYGPVGFGRHPNTPYAHRLEDNFEYIFEYNQGVSLGIKSDGALLNQVMAYPSRDAVYFMIRINHPKTRLRVERII